MQLAQPPVQPVVLPAPRLWRGEPAGQQPVGFVIYAEAASKANGRRHVLLAGKSASIKSAKALAFVAAVRQQIPPAARVMFDVDVAVELRMHYRTERPDLDESALLDALQAVYVKPPATAADPNPEPLLAMRGVYRNDRQVRERHVSHHIDRDNPRVEVVVYPRSHSLWECHADVQRPLVPAS